MKTTEACRVAVVAAALGVLCIPAGAAVISPLNGGFEGLPNGLPSFPPSLVYIFDVVPENWAPGPSANHQIIHHTLASTTFPHPLYAAPTDGITLYAIETSGSTSWISAIQQNLGTMTVGETYTFQAMLYSNSEGLPCHYRISFKNATDNNELKYITEANFDPSALGIRKVVPASFSYTASMADDGDLMQLILAPTTGLGAARTGIDAVTVTSTFEPPGLAHQWTFEEGTAEDSVGSAHGTLYNGAGIGGGRLHLDGMNDYVRTSPVDNTITEKTLVAWLKLDNLAQRSGGVLTLENTGSTGSDDVFDSIVYGERTASQWMNGSNGWSRSDGVNNGGPLETTLEEIMLAITYRPGGAIDIYRNGEPYASYTTGGPISYTGGVADVLLGLRHWDAAGQTGTTPTGNDAYWAGWVDEARIYNRALTPAEVLYLFNEGPVVPEPGTFALLALGWGVLGLAGLRRARRRRTPAA